MTVNELNNLSIEEATTEFLKCCGSQSWAEKMRRRMPFESKEEIIFYAERAWENCSNEAKLEAFRAHPKIGDKASLAKKYANTTEWASNEQSGVDNANEEILNQLALKNEEYYEKFRYIFIVCATGKSAEEMLQILESRLPNEAEEEFKIAAAEQQKITEIRLKKLLA